MECGKWDIGRKGRLPFARGMSWHTIDLQRCRGVGPLRLTYSDAVGIADTESQEVRCYPTFGVHSPIDRK